MTVRRVCMQPQGERNGGDRDRAETVPQVARWPSVQRPGAFRRRRPFISAHLLATSSHQLDAWVPAGQGQCASGRTYIHTRMHLLDGRRTYICASSRTYTDDADATHLLGAGTNPTTIPARFLCSGAR
jgi:hypothetical protein